MHKEIVIGGLYVLDLEVTFVLVRRHVQLCLLPQFTNLIQAYFNSQLLGGSTRDVIDLFCILVKAPLNDALQRELW